MCQNEPACILEDCCCSAITEKKINIIEISLVLTDHEYVVVRVITNQSYLRGLCPRNGPKVTLTYLSMFLITLSNDVNINPEPSTSDSLYPCGTCDKPVTWDDRGIVCDTCNQWYHANCQSMKSSLYLEHVNDCCSLGLPCLQLPQL